MARPQEVSIIGAGPVGLVAALYLARRGVRVTVYEGRPDPRKLRPVGGRSINLTLAARGWKALADVGADAAVRQISLPLAGRLIHHESGRTTAQPYGPRGERMYTVSRAQLTRTLIQLVEDAPNVRLLFGHRLLQVDPPTGLLELERPEHGTAVNVRASVVLAADGAYSAARPSLLRIHAREYRQAYSRHWYKELRIPARDDWPLDPERTHVWPRKDTMLVAFPNLTRAFTATLFLPLEGAPSFRSLQTREDLLALFRSTFSDVVALAPDLDFAFFAKAMSPLLTMTCAPWTHKGKFALIGDAAHSMVPFLGQGMNAGLEDCTVLDEAIAHHEFDWPKVLGEYEERRKPECDVVTELAERHYQELAVAVDDEAFLRRRRIEQRLHEDHPDRFVPTFTLLTFTCLPYSLAPTLAARQQPLVDALAAIPDVEQAWRSEPVQALVRAYVDGVPPLSLGDVATWVRTQPPPPPASTT